ncbi:MAG: glutamine--fructose-6-phosphate transaminase (isomerizing) [Deltaproteobacteria bacterium]|nr:glutamine--fructose-6-phosphate transaminase (isomerizing) [Deltaproteobacteria bacterium]
MCGIVAYVGPKEAAPLILEGLRRLEYRGYDSAGIAVRSDAGGGTLAVVRCEGKLARLEEAVRRAPPSGTRGVGHTRWATHGRPSERNAHPPQVGRVAVVHNGIIENHLEVRRRLEGQGRTFASETDTEIAAHLLDEALAAGASLVEAMRRAVRQIEGSYALAAVDARTGDRLVVAKNASPLILGIGDGEMFAASDIPAILPYTNRVIPLEEGELAELTRDGVRIEDAAGRPVSRAVRRIDWSPLQAEKGGFKHFMLKEIHEQPRAVEDTLRGRIVADRTGVFLEGAELDDETARSLHRVVLVACGTSFHAAMSGQRWLEGLAGVPAVAELASEFRGREPIVGEHDLVVAVSQSGETIDTLAAAKLARERGARILAVANVLDSAIPRAAHGSLYTHAGPEIGVASTKCFVAQLAALALLALRLGSARGRLDAGGLAELTAALLRIPGRMREAIARNSGVETLGRALASAPNWLYLGRGRSYPIALEGALKLKEISYIHAEGYAAGEMKHGPIALIDRNVPVVAVVPHDEQFEKMMGNVHEVHAREARVVAVTDREDPELRTLSEEVLTVGETLPAFSPFLTVLPLQLLAYHIADFKGTDVDQPRNLAKTVTVE